MYIGTEMLWFIGSIAAVLFVVASWKLRNHLKKGERD